MVSREITIGRAENSDIYLDPRCEYASGNHGTIYWDGYQLIFKDTSSNGTVINNTKIHHQSVPIRKGDVIMIAGKYQLSWNAIDKFFPNLPQKRGGATVLDQPQPAAGSGAGSGTSAGQSDASSSTDEQPLTDKWSWGAFMLYPIWGFFNGCWWAIFVYLFLCWTIIPAIVFGIYGRRWSWKNKQWSSALNFNKTQATWDKVGLILFIINIVMTVISILFSILFYASILSALN